MKNVVKLVACLVISSMLFEGCNSINDENVIINNNTNINNDNQGSNNGGSSNSTVINSGKNNKQEGNKPTIALDVEKLLGEIKTNSQLGKVINCNIIAGKSIYEDATAKWGEADSVENVEAAKGMYATFKKENIVVGMNKGEAIFEVRSFDDSIKKITLKDVENYYGNPQYNITTSLDEKLIGYEVNENYKIEFVFSKVTGENITLDHYLILYPKGTVNLMADDPGRQW